MTAKLKISPKNKILRAAIKRFEEAVADVAVLKSGAEPSDEENDMFIAEEYRLAKSNLCSLIGLTKRSK